MCEAFYVRTFSLLTVERKGCETESTTHLNEMKTREAITEDLPRSAQCCLYAPCLYVSLPVSTASGRPNVPFSETHDNNFKQEGDKNNQRKCSPLNFLVYFLKKVQFSLPQRG
ncbi:hypothetical protein AVEN_23766-1 [Araneus ventricosus]|uniref:Uncharacterized protein n=1 Tax=Araneus ventricosus TaxID=182803 RepID=A0A4Y2HMN2_ARAVE|nr:hypothetical protein AVEN_23766-1 [Araneus ventricosus]